MGNLRAVVAMVIACAGCLEANLVPCGEVQCPAGDICLAGTRCVTGAQLTACAGTADGSACTINGTGAVCVGGACTPSVCGNGAIDPGEVCDDGNTVSGDGCNSTCTSTETCGNGIVDIEVGEGCDCGTADHLSPLCTVPNSADPSAPCDLSCHPRFCGDGVIDTIEQCDGTALPAGQSCANFGYYGGTLGCTSFCQLDPSSCVGRCGDGIVQPDHEFCDGSVPLPASCVTFGYDYGDLGCGLSCGADFSPCGALGWNPVPGFTGSVGVLWGGGGRIAVVTTAGIALVYDAAAWSQATATYTTVTGTATTVWAVGPTDVASWTHAAGWIDTPAPWPSGSTVVSAWASDTLGVWVSVAEAAPLWHFDGTAWTTVAGSWPAGTRLGKTLGQLWVLDTTPDIWDGATWTQAGISNIKDIFEDGTGTLWAQGVTEIYQLAPGGTWTDFDSGTIRAAAASGYYTATTLCGLSCSSTLYRYDPLLSYVVDNTAQGPIVDDGRGRIYGPSGSGLVVIAYGLWTVDYEVDQFSGNVALAPGGLWTLTTNLGGETDALDYGYWNTITTPGPCETSMVTAAGALYCTIPSQQELYDDDDGGISGVTVRVLWMGANGDVAAGGIDVFAMRSAGTWSTSTPTLEFGQFAGDALDDLYATASTDGVTPSALWHFDGTSWQAIAGTDGYSQLAVTPTTVYLTDGNGILPLLAVSRATGAVTAIELPVAPQLIAHGSGENLYIVIDNSTLEHNSPLWQYDGTAWSPISVPAAMGYIIALSADERDVLLTTHGGSSLQIDTQYYRLVRTGP